jgi:hypothetical protein
VACPFLSNPVGSPAGVIQPQSQDAAADVGWERLCRLVPGLMTRYSTPHPVSWPTPQMEDAPLEPSAIWGGLLDSLEVIVLIQKVL